VGVDTLLGTVTSGGTVGSAPGSFGAGLNSRGQVLLSARLDNGSPTLVLLTPAAL
jgi:hypothetical protein